MRFKLLLLAIAIYTVSVCCGAIFRKSLSPTLRIAHTLLTLNLATELLSIGAVKVFHSNSQLYHVFNMTELCIYGLYFDRLLKMMARSRLAVLVACISILAFIINVCYFQPWKVFNSNFLLFEGFCVIAMCLIALSQMFLDDNVLYVTLKVDFWLCQCILFYWCATYFCWALVAMEKLRHGYLHELIMYLVLLYNVVFAGGIGVVFYLNKKRLLHE